jgi:hypothetical protein
MSFEQGVLSLNLRPDDPSQAAALLERLRARASVNGVDIRVESAGATGQPALRVTASAVGWR